MSESLLEIAQPIVVDRGLREQFLIDPKPVLADLGLSAGAYRALVAIIPILLVGGIGIIDAAGPDPLANNPLVGWGRG